MRIALFLIVLLALNVYSADAWGIRRVFRSIRRAIRRVVSPIVRIVRPIVRLVKPLAKEAAICYAKDYALGKVWSYGKTLLGKRDINDVDVNMDGALDHAELESLLETRDAEDFLRLADINGDNKIDVDEFERAMSEDVYQ